MNERTAVLTLLIATFATFAAAQEAIEHRALHETRIESRAYLGQGVTQAELSNGLTVLIRENHAAPLATVRAFVRSTGSVYEGKYLGAGISHLAEHLVSGGTTTKRSEKEIRAIVDSLGGQTNAYTSNDITAYHIDCPAKRVDQAIELVADSIQHVTFDQTEYRRELGVVQRELEMGESDRSRVLYQTMKELVFTEHPMRHPIIGYLPVLQQITRDDVIDFYQRRYVPQNVVFVVAGDVETQSVLNAVLANFKDFARTTERGPVLPVEPDQASPRLARREMEGETTQLALAWPTVPLQHPDLYALDVASYLLTNGDSSRLVRRLKIDEPLAISVGSASYTPGFVKGWFQIAAECQPENVEQCRKIILEEIERLKQQAPGDSELAKVKRQKAAEHVFSQQTVQAQAEALARSFLATGDPLFDDQYVKGIESVTADEVSAAVQKYLQPQRLNTVTIAPLGEGGEDKVESLAGDVESDVVRKQLSNGLTVLLKRNSVLPLVSIQAFAKGGVVTDTAETSGRASLATDLMTRGTAKYTAEQIAEYFDSIGGQFQADSQRNTSFVQANVLKDNFEQSLDYVYQVLFQPTFPQEEFTKVQQLQLGRIAARRANPQTEILDFWTSLVPAESPYSRTVLGKTETVAQLTVEDVRQWHRRVFVPNNIVFAVFGDVDPERAMSLIEAKFGKLPTGEPSIPQFEKGHASAAPAAQELKTQRPGTAMVVVGYPTVSALDSETRAALDMLGAVLTGGSGAGGRLFDELRGDRLVYFVFGFELTGLAPGYYLYMAQTRPETAAEVVERIQANLKKIETEGIPQDEFKLAKEKLIAAHALKNNTPTQQAFQAALDELYGLGYDFDQKYDERLQKVTVDDVQQVAKQYFNKAIIATSVPDEATAATK